MNIVLKNLLSSNKFIPIYLERKNIAKGTLGPHSVELHCTSLCNNRCIHCSYGNRRQKNAGLSDKIISSIISDLIELKTRSVYISGGGEPTLVKKWQMHAERMMNNNIYVALITNGTNIRKTDLGTVRRLNYIAVSVYSSDEAEYKLITGSSFFSRQFDIPSLIKIKNNSAVVGARCVINKINYKSVISIYQKAMEAGYDYVIFIPVIDYESKGIGLSPAEKARVRMSVEKAYRKLDFSRTNLDTVLVRGVEHYEGEDYRRDFSIPPAVCHAADMRSNAFVNYDGGVYLCQPYISNAEYCIGNVNDNRFKDIWNSERHREIVKKMNRRFSSGLCKECRSIAFNKKVDEYENSGSAVFTITKDNFI